MSKPVIVVLMDALHSEGAENVAVNIAVRVKHLGHFEPIVCVTRWGGVLESALVENDVPYVVLDRRHAYQAHKFLPLRRLIRERNVRLIHAHKIGSNFWGSVVGRWSGTPVISHFHAHHAKGGSLPSLMAARIVGQVSRRVISISEYEKRRLIDEEGIPPGKIVTIYNGIDLGRYHPGPNPQLRRELGIGDDVPVVGIVAAFRPQKNHELFLRAARHVLERHGEVVFLLVGDGVKRAESEAFAEELGITSNCRFLGLRRDVPDVIGAMDVGVLSSHWEGLPLAMLEYMASGKAVVSTDVSGMGEVVEQGVNGLLTPPDNSEALADAISVILADRRKAERMGRRGVEIARDKFSEETMIDRIEALYEETLSSNGNRSDRIRSS